MGVRALGCAVLLLALTVGFGCSADDDRRFSHIFVIVEENHGYDQVIGNPAAPNINRLADAYGSATSFYAEVHPSEANYIAMLGGSTFGIHDDDAWYCTAGNGDQYCAKSKRENYAPHTIASDSLIDQLDSHGLSWKGYFESIPEPGSKAIVSTGSDGQPDRLYAAKHNGFINFATVQKDRRLDRKLVGFDQLAKDLASGDAPSYAHIVPNQCNEMHGLDNDAPNVPADCRFDNEPGLIARGDRVIGELVRQIQASPLWSAKENAAIIITWDEDDGPHKTRDAGKVQGCCGFDPNSPANYGGGRIATIVITNHGPQGVKDDTPYNHYSLLRTTEDAFGIAEHLGLADDTAHGVKPMDRLFWK